MDYNNITTTAILPQSQQHKEDKQNESLSYINYKPIAFLPPSLIQINLQSEERQPLLSINLNNNISNNSNSPPLNLFNDPIFYSVFLGCVFFIASIFNQISISNFRIFINVPGIVFPFVGCIISPVIVSKIKTNNSISLGVAILFILNILPYCSSYWYQAFIISIRSITIQVVSISILYLITLVNYESKYKSILFAIYFLVQYGLFFFVQEISFLKLEKAIIVIPLFILSLIFVFLLSKLDKSAPIPSDDTAAESCLNKKSIMLKEFINDSFLSNNKLYLIPIIIFIGTCNVGFAYYTFDYLSAAITAVLVGLIIFKFGKLIAFKCIMLFGVVFVSMAFATAFKEDFNKYAHSIGFLSILYSIFSSGTMVIIYSMLDELFSKDRLLIGISTIYALIFISNLIGLIFNIGYVIFIIGWYIIMISITPVCISFMTFLSSQSINQSNNK